MIDRKHEVEFWHYGSDCPKRVGSNDPHLRKFIDDVAVFGSTSHDYVSSIDKFTCPVCGSDKELALYDPVEEDYDGRFFTSTETFTCCDCGSEFEVTSVYRRECVYVSEVTDNRFYEED